MFRKLRLKLMLVNLSVIFMLFSLLIIGTYFFVQERMLEGGAHMMDRLSYDLVTGKLVDLPLDHKLDKGKPNELRPEHGPGAPGGPGPVFFIKLDSLGQILHTSSFIPLTKEQISRLVVQTTKKEQNKGSILFDQREYVYRISPPGEQQERFIIFQDFERDRNLLTALVTGLGITGIVCMILSLFGSLFMANKAMVPIKRAWQQQKEFLADASHEFRTPLAVIQTNLELVRDNPEETVQSQDHWLNNIYEETVCMTKLVESLLFLARADSHQQLLVKDHFLLNQGVVTAVELFRPMAVTAGISLIVKAEEEILYYADEAKLRQVVSILMDNALRHTSMNGQIIIRLEKTKEDILLSVSDTGEGIDSEHLEKIFQRFYQSDVSRFRGGAGLGLSIAKWIVESHDGSIQVISGLGQGSIFTVLLPHP